MNNHNNCEFEFAFDEFGRIIINDQRLLDQINGAELSQLLSDTNRACGSNGACGNAACENAGCR